MRGKKATAVPVAGSRKVEWWRDPQFSKEREEIHQFILDYDEKIGSHYNPDKLVRVKSNGDFEFIDGDVKAEFQAYSEKLVVLLQRKFPNWEITPDLELGEWGFFPKALL